MFNPCFLFGLLSHCKRWWAPLREQDEPSEGPNP